MSKPSWFRGKNLVQYKQRIRHFCLVAKKSNLIFFAIGLVIFAIMISLWNSQTTAYAHASMEIEKGKSQVVSPLLGNENNLFDSKKRDYVQNIIPSKNIKKISPKESGKKEPAATKIEVPAPKNDSGASLEDQSKIIANNPLAGSQAGPLVFDAASQTTTEKNKSNEFAEKLYSIVGETPLKDMVPYISQRDEKVAAFLVGIAKKESSFGLASPSKDGKTCFNYWGYKGEGGRGTGMGYACFASAEEAIQTVGDRIEVLVNKNRNTPARMVDTWKCGVSCAGDPGAPGWTSTVALYFDQIVEKNS
ncbi:MAG: hypothetical protein PHW24_02150 [Candidatus Moranbacteria bacterium]|nr:hypothetical protein [Candidatus Moranbacteria bacterium]